MAAEKGTGTRSQRSRRSRTWTTTVTGNEPPEWRVQSANRRTFILIAWRKSARRSASSSACPFCVGFEQSAVLERTLKMSCWLPHLSTFANKSLFIYIYIYKVCLKGTSSGEAAESTNEKYSELAAVHERSGGESGSHADRDATILPLLIGG